MNLSGFAMRLFSYYKNMKLYVKIMLYFIILFLLPITMFSIFSLPVVTNEIEENVIYSSQKSFQQVSRIMDSMFYNVENIKNSIILNNKLREIFSKNPLHYPIDEQINDRKDVKQIFISLQNNWNVERVRIYLDKDYKYLKDNVDLFGFEKIENEVWLNKLRTHTDSFMWFPPVYFNNEDSKENVVFLAKFMDPNDYSQMIGIIRIDVKEQWLLEVLKNSVSVENSVVYIQNNIGENVAIINDSDLADLDIKQSIKEIHLNDNDWKYHHIDNNKLIVGSITLNNDDWRMVYLIPYNNIEKTAIMLFTKQMSVLILVALIALSAAAILSNRFSKRVDNLITRMNDIHSGNFNTIIVNNENDEIGKVINNYNFMMKKINEVIQEKYLMGQQVKDTELRLLQSQINPHFLYNTLDLIQSLAVQKDTATLCEVISSLSKYYKLSLNKGKDIVNLSEEIQHIKEYIYIQNIRFDLEVQLNINIKTNVDLLLPKLTLQPLVENCILHGIRPKSVKKGIIQINAYNNDKENIIEIIDNGIGISEDKIDSIINKRKNSGFAVWNINERIKLLYGKKYGLSYSSELNSGTKVKITLPF